MRQTTRYPETLGGLDFRRARFDWSRLILPVYCALMLAGFGWVAAILLKAFLISAEIADRIAGGLL